MGRVSFKQFQELDIRIGTVVKAEVPKWSHWVIKLTVDMGELSTDNGLQTTAGQGKNGETTDNGLLTSDKVQVQVQEEDRNKISKLDPSTALRMTKSDPSTRSARSGRQGRTIVVFAGLLGFYKPEELEGKQFPFIVNLEPKKIGPEGDYSEGMMLAGAEKLIKLVKVVDPSFTQGSGRAQEETDEKPILLIPSEKVPSGTKVR
jgi:tRNA-binding EMAP/Myf-like protein